MKRTPIRQMALICGALLLSFSPHRPAIADLLAYYSFDGANPGDDAGPHGNHADAFGGVTVIPFGGAVDGLGYLQMNGTDSFLHTPLNVNPNVMPTFTMGAWARVPSGTAPGIRQVLAHDDGGWDRAIGTDVRGDADGMGDATYRYTGFTGNGPLGNTTPVAGTEDNWVFLAISYDAPNSTMRMHVDENVFTATPVHGLSGHNMFIGANPLGGALPAEYWVGDIDNVFLYDTALDQGLVDAIRTAGPPVILTLADFQPERVLAQSWTFESGDLSGFHVVAGTAFDNQPTYGDNPGARGAPRLAGVIGSGVEGNYALGTFENRPTEADAVGTQGDAVMGTIETDSWVVGEDGLLTFKIGGGNHGWDPNWDPDTNPAPLNAGPTAVTLDRLVGPDDWEVVMSATGKDNEVMHNVRWDLASLEGQTVRLRVYDNHSAGWGHINVDDFRYFQAVPEPTTCVFCLFGLAGLIGMARRQS